VVAKCRKAHWAVPKGGSLRICHPGRALATTPGGPGRVGRWASGQPGAATLHLWVTENNAPARRRYARAGFALTGERQPLPSDPSLAEVAMSRPLGPMRAPGTWP